MEGQKPQEFIEISGLVLGVHVFIWVSLTEAWMYQLRTLKDFEVEAFLALSLDWAKVKDKHYHCIPHIQAPPPNPTWIPDHCQAAKAQLRPHTEKFTGMMKPKIYSAQTPSKNTWKK